MGIPSIPRRLLVHASVAALASSLAATSSMAQTSPVPPRTGAPTEGQTANSTPADVAPEQVDGLADIVVTAQRREETLQRTALAVSAVSGEALAKANVTDVTSLTKLVPSLIVQPATGTSVGFYLRGVGSLVGNAFTENPVAFNYGGVYVARPAALLGTFYDLQRVEVLKGPQGTLYGRNATGGAINVIPNRPVLGRRSLDLSVETGNYKSIRTQAAVNLPLGPTLALRLAGQVASRGPYLSDGYDDEVGQAARGSLLFTPSSAVSLLLSADYFHQGGRGPGAVLAQGALTPNAPPASARVGASDPRSLAVLNADYPALFVPGLVRAPANDGYVDSRFWGVSADIDVDLGFAKLTVLPAYRDSRPNYLSYSGGYYARVNESARQTSVEARLASSAGGPFNYVIGGYFFNEDQSGLNDFNPGLITRTTFSPKLTNRSYAGFGQATYAILTGFRLVAGGRYTHETKKQDTVLTQTSFGVGPTSRALGDATFNKFTYKAGFEWDVAPRNLLYANVATGFKSGGFFIAALDNAYRPENITAYTVGSKNRFLGNRLQFNVEGFYWKYKDQQVNFIGPIRTSATTIGTGLVTTNAGRSRIFGAEAELSLQATKLDLFSANLQYLNGKYTEFSFLNSSPNGAPPRTTCVTTPSTGIAIPAPGRAFLVDCAGKPQINSPRVSVNLSYEHSFVLTGAFELVAGARSKIEGSRFLSPEYLPEERQGGYTQSDAFLTLSNKDDRYSITAFVNNLENSTVLAGTAVRPILPLVYNILRAPRTYGVRAAFSFR